MLCDASKLLTCSTAEELHCCDGGTEAFNSLKMMLRQSACIRTDDLGIRR